MREDYGLGKKARAFRIFEKEPITYKAVVKVLSTLAIKKGVGFYENSIIPKRKIISTNWGKLKTNFATALAGSKKEQRAFDKILEAKMMPKGLI